MSKLVRLLEQELRLYLEKRGYSCRSKLDNMSINYGKKNTLFATLEFAGAIVNSNYSDEESVIDTFTYLYEIKGGYEKETYENEPYLFPYVVDGSDSVVIVIPGKISLIGFSAGGNEIGTFINIVQGRNLFPEDYTPDEVDAVEDRLVSTYRTQ